MDMQNAELGNGVFLGALDSMMDHIAIVDKQGIIEWTNNGWNAFSKNNGGQPSTTGQGRTIFPSASQAPATVARVLLKYSVASQM